MTANSIKFILKANALSLHVNISPRLLSLRSHVPSFHLFAPFTLQPSSLSLGSLLPSARRFALICSLQLV